MFHFYANNGVRKDNPIQPALIAAQRNMYCPITLPLKANWPIRKKAKKGSPAAII